MLQDLLSCLCCFRGSAELGKTLGVVGENKMAGANLRLKEACKHTSCGANAV